MILRWHPQARVEVDHAANFYRDKQHGLEIRFLDRLEDTLRGIQRHPNSYRPLTESVRACRIPHFPYAVIYRTTADSIQIIAVMHVRRAPGYWIPRI